MGRRAAGSASPVDRLQRQDRRHDVLRRIRSSRGEGQRRDQQRMRVLNALIHIITIRRRRGRVRAQARRRRAKPIYLGVLDPGPQQLGREDDRCRICSCLAAHPLTLGDVFLRCHGISEERYAAHRCAGAAMRWKRGCAAAAGAGGQRFGRQSSVSSVLQAASAISSAEPWKPLPGAVPLKLVHS